MRSLKVPERTPTEVRDQARLASAADSQHRYKTRAGVQMLRQFEQRLATTDEGVAFRRKAVSDIPGRQPNVALENDTIALGCIGRRRKRRGGVADLEQFDRL